jgi:hypothetical protein
MGVNSSGEAGPRECPNTRRFLDVASRYRRAVVSAKMTRQRETRDFDDEDTCHEGNLDLVHLKNVYEQFHGTTKWPSGQQCPW